MSILASKVLGCSNRLTMRRYEGCFLVFKILMSLLLREKKAISLPAVINDKKSRSNATKIKTVTAAVFKARK